MTKVEGTVVHLERYFQLEAEISALRLQEMALNHQRAALEADRDVTLLLDWKLEREGAQRYLRLPDGRVVLLKRTYDRVYVYPVIVEQL